MNPNGREMPVHEGFDPYVLLGLSRDAGTKEIRLAYRDAAKMAHPDVGGDRSSFEEIRLARDVLMDPDRRAYFDRTGRVAAERVDNEMAVALEMVSSALHDALAGLGNDPNPLAHDLVGLMIRKLDEAEEAERAGFAALAEAAAANRLLLGRFVVPPGAVNHLDQIVSARVRLALENMAAIERRGVVRARARAIIAAHSFTRSVGGSMRVLS